MTTERIELYVLAPDKVWAVRSLQPSDAYEYCIDKHRAYVTYASLFVFPRQFDWGALSVCPKPFGFKGLKSHAWL